MLLEPAMVDAKVDEIDDDDDDVEGDIVVGTLAVAERWSEVKQGSGLLAGWLKCWADVDKPLDNLYALELKLFAELLVMSRLDPANRDRCIWAR